MILNLDSVLIERFREGELRNCDKKLSVANCYSLKNKQKDVNGKTQKQLQLREIDSIYQISHYDPKVCLNQEQYHFKNITFNRQKEKFCKIDWFPAYKHIIRIIQNL